MELPEIMTHTSGIYQRSFSNGKWGIGFRKLKFNYGTFHYFKMYHKFNKGAIVVIEFLNDVPVSLKQLEIWNKTEIQLNDNQLLVVVGSGFKSAQEHSHRVLFLKCPELVDEEQVIFPS